MRVISGQIVKKGKLEPYSFQVASAWEELTPAQTASCLEVLTFKGANKYLRAVSLLCLLFERMDVLEQLNDTELLALMPLTDFLITDQPEPVNKFPNLVISDKIYFAPADDLSNIGFGEWCFAYEFYAAYLKTREKDYLDRLIATIFRQKDKKQRPDHPLFSGDIRLPFNENMIEKTAENLSKTGDGIKTAVFTWFASAMFQVMKQRPHIFTVGSPTDQSAGQRTWFSVFRDLLGPKWGTTEQLKYTNAIFVLDALEEQMTENEKLTR